MFKILPFKPNSTGARILADNLPGELIEAGYRRQRSDCLVNWGCGWSRTSVDVNQPEAICNAVNKLRAFDLFRNNDVPHPSHTTNRGVATKWLKAGHNVYARATMEGERGRGITVVKPTDLEQYMGGEFQAPVYIKGFPTAREFRVHCAFGEVIEVNEKKRRNGTNPDPFVRSSSDWVFCVYNLKPYPRPLLDAALGAVDALGLDFGGVDVAIDDHDNVCVFEVNTAPWINRESTTKAYCDIFREHFA